MNQQHRQFSADDFLEMRDRINRMQAYIDQNPQQPQQIPPARGDARSETIICNFFRSVSRTHADHNPDQVTLAYDGHNFQVWEKEINRTLDFVFQADSFTQLEDNFNLREKNEQKAISALLRMTIVKALRDILDGADSDSPWKIFKLLKQKCSHSDRQHKLSVVGRLVNLASDKSPGNDVTLSNWTKVSSELTQMKVTVDELLGLMFQNCFVAPAERQQDIRLLH